ncbi:MAG TPA: hypothetical protein VI758_02585 [Bacteroidota bacterium]
MDENVLFVAAGVFSYVEEGQIKEILRKLSVAFPGGELVFDAASPLGVATANVVVPSMKPTATVSTPCRQFSHPTFR